MMGLWMWLIIPPVLHCLNPFQEYTENKWENTAYGVDKGRD